MKIRNSNINKKRSQRMHKWIGSRFVTTKNKFEEIQEDFITRII